MIDDVDAALTALLRARLPKGTEVIVGPPPDAKAVGARHSVSLLLHDIREDLARRATEAEPVRDSNGHMLSRRVPPRRFHLSYLVSAAASDTAAEHRLLSEALSVLASCEQVPAEFVGGGLAQQGVPVLLAVWPDRPDRSIEPPTDVWSSLGLRLRPSVDLRVTSPLVPLAVEEVGPPVVERLLEFDNTGDGGRESRREPAEVVARRRATLVEGRAPVEPARRSRRG